MLFKSRNVRATLTGLTTKQGLVLDIPRDGKLLVCSGDTLRGVVQLDDPGKIDSLLIEFAGYQYVAVEGIARAPMESSMKINPTSIVGGTGAAGAASSRAVIQKVATRLFTIVHQISKAEAGSAGGAVNFEFVVPDKSKRGEQLPPSMQLKSTRLAGGSMGYCRYQVTVMIERKSMGRMKSENVILPVLYTPFSPVSSPPNFPAISDLLTRTTPDKPPTVPSDWKAHVAKDVWEVEVPGGLTGLVRRRSRGEEATEGIMRAQFSTPNLEIWPPGRPIPYHLLLTFTSSTPSTLALAHSELNFNLKQWIQTSKPASSMAQAFVEVVEPGSSSSTSSKEKEKDKAAFGFDLTKDGIWSESREDGDGWHKALVQMGTIQVSGTPTVLTDIINLIYQIRLNVVLPSDSVFGGKKNTFILGQPLISSSVYEGMPGLPSDEDQTEERRALLKTGLRQVGRYYWDEEQDFAGLRD